MNELGFPHSSVPLIDRDGRLTREGHRFLFGLWTKVGAGATPTVDAAVSGTAGASYTATEQQVINDLVTLVNQMRQTLADNGLIQ